VGAVVRVAPDLAYWVSDTVRVPDSPLTALGVGGSLLCEALGADATAEIPTVTDFATVTCTDAAAFRIPTRSTAAVPMAAIDSATASQPTASPAT
jgi:hypothetical protein